LKEGARKIDEADNPQSIVSPCDGKIFSFGDIEKATMMAVKGSIYSVDDLLFGKEN